VRLTFTDFETWNMRARLHISTGIRPHAFQYAGGRHLRLAPALAEHDNLFILGRDWIPVHRDGLATADRMIHSPQLYAGKAKAFHVDSEGQRKAVAQSVIHCQEPLILVGGAQNYYHWLIDYLPRLLIAEQFPQYDDCRVLVNSELTNFQTESLELLGIGCERLVSASLNDMVAARTCVVSALLASNTFCHPMVPRMLRSAFPISKPPTIRRRIYLRRQEATTRRLLNEDSFLNLLEKFNFESHDPGMMGFQDQIDLMSEAEAIVAVHGAGMANIVFAPRGTAVLEISSPARRVTSMRNLALLLGHSHEFVDATIPFEKDTNPLLNDWEVDVRGASVALSRALSL